MASRQSKNFKKNINRDVTQEDQLQAKDEKSYQKRDGKRANYARKKTKGQRGGAETGKAGYYSYNDNDFSWYSTNPQLLFTAAQIAFSQWAGEITQPNSEGTITGSFPGLMAFKIMPTYGLELTSTDPLNVAAQKLWAYIFRTVSGQTFANAPDMMIFLLGMCEVYSYITWLQRLYGEVNKWTPGNSYMPEAYATAESVNFSDLRANRLEFANCISMLIDQASSLCVPKDYTLFQRRAFIFQNIYTEGISTKSQQYMFVPQGFMQFQLDSTTKAGQLKMLVVPSNATVSQLFNYGQNMINALLADEDTKKLSSLVLRAFGDAGIIKLNQMPLNYTTPIVYSLEVLEQMKNADIIPLQQIDIASRMLTQDPATVTIKYNLTATKPATDIGQWQLLKTKAAATKYLTTGVADPGPEVSVINTRLCCRVVDTGGSTLSIIPASELCTGVNVIYRYDGGSGPFMKIQTLTNYPAVGVSSNTDLVGYLNASGSFNALMSVFKFCPSYTLQITNTDGTSVLSKYLGMPVFDVDNWTILDMNLLQKLNRTVMYNLLDSTNVAKAWQG